ncbi:MAG: UDP-N-acetylmuramate dehydrogenase [Lachnospiraceae bacterium]|nr:UDP-N-acetylmuramate dehydrogenase [Lachnospiraceae bacterium]
MRLHTTFRVGGPAALFLELQSEQEFRDILTLLHAEEEDYFTVGNGSNLLISDTGYNGVILHPSKNFGDVRVEGERLICESGATLAAIARTALEQELTGFEFAAGIPGSLGGAIVMNAGAYDGEMKQVVETVKLITPEGEIITKDSEEMEFSYRHSILKEKPYLVLSVTIKLRKGEKEQIKARMEELAQKRREKQPLEYPSAGSTFKRPEGDFAAKLIQDAGLRGLMVGGAQVSEKHCGFVINKDQATAKDIYELMKRVQEQIKEKYGVMLEPEVICLGDFQ